MRIVKTKIYPLILNIPLLGLFPKWTQAAQSGGIDPLGILGPLQQVSSSFSGGILYYIGMGAIVVGALILAIGNQDLNAIYKRIAWLSITIGIAVNAPRIMTAFGALT